MISRIKKSFVMYVDMYEPTKTLSATQKGELWDAVFCYHGGCEPEIADPMVRMAFSFFRQTFARDAEEYERRCAKNRENVRRRWEGRQSDERAALSDDAGYGGGRVAGYDGGFPAGGAGMSRADLSAVGGGFPAGSGDPSSGGLPAGGVPSGGTEYDGTGSYEVAEDRIMSHGVADGGSAASRVAGGRRAAASGGTDNDHETEHDSDSDTGRPPRSPGGGRTRFTPPDPEQVRAYCRERGNTVNADRFCDYYAAQGWRLSNGRPLKDWKAAVRNWESRERASGGMFEVERRQARNNEVCRQVAAELEAMGGPF